MSLTAILCGFGILIIGFLLALKIWQDDKIEEKKTKGGIYR